MGKKAQKSAKTKESSKAPVENTKQHLEIDFEAIYAHQRKLELLCEEAEKSKNAKYFMKVKYKQNIYQLGEYVHLYDVTGSLPYVAKIHSIIRIPQQDVAVILKIEWLLRKTDLPAKYQKMLKHFSSAEVFPSGQIDCVPVESIMRKCYVIQNTEYEYLQNAGDNIHFTRAALNARTRELEPHPSEWTKECYCGSPVNPDLAYIQCEKCQHWYHHECVKDPKLIEAEVFNCNNCLGKRK